MRAHVPSSVRSEGRSGHECAEHDDEQHLPSDLLRGPLNLTSGCYLPSCAPEPLDSNLTLYKLLEEDGSTASGYGSALDAMLASGGMDDLIIWSL